MRGMHSNRWDLVPGTAVSSDRKMPRSVEAQALWMEIVVSPSDIPRCRHIPIRVLEPSQLSMG